MVPVRIAMKVARFDQRVGRRQLLALEMIGQDAVFDRAEQRGDDAETGERDEQNRHRLHARSRRSRAPRRRSRRTSATAPRAPCRSGRRVRRRARTGRNTGAMKTAPASVISAPASAPPRRKRMRKTSAVLRKLSLNAAKNWHQNSGAKRLDSSSGGMPQIAQKRRRESAAKSAQKRGAARHNRPPPSLELRLVL